MITHDGYSSRYEKAKSSNRRSVSPSPLPQTHSPHKTSPTPEGQDQLGKVVSKLSERVEGIEIKIVTITNIVKLLQKYSESKDEQYQKQKENQQFQKNIGQRVGSIESLEIQSRLKEFQFLSQRVKSEITAMESLRVGISRENSKKTLNSPEPFRLGSIEQAGINPEIEDALVELETNMRDQINKKMEICLNYLKKVKQPAVTPTAVNSIMLQQQIHNLTLTVNKIEGDCLRNSMLMEKKIQQLSPLISTLHQTALKKNEEYFGRSASRSRSRTNRDYPSGKSPDGTPSDKSKSKSHKKTKKISIRSEQGIGSALQEKKAKENELKQALRRKKDNQERLRMKK